MISIVPCFCSPPIRPGRSESVRLCRVRSSKGRGDGRLFPETHEFLNFGSAAPCRPRLFVDNSTKRCGVAGNRQCIPARTTGGTPNAGRLTTLTTEGSRVRAGKEI